MQYYITTPFVKYEVAARKDSYKLAVENSNGSIDIIFNLPKHFQLNKIVGYTEQLSTNLTNKKPQERSTFIIKQSDSSLERTKRKNKKQSLASVKRRSVSGRKTLYPVTLESPYIINNPDICNTDSNINFLFIVHTATNHFQRRRTIRETWANTHIFRNITLKVVFMLGLTEDKTDRLRIENENMVYRDIVQGDFLDSYHNLTHKGVLAYRWITEHCNNTEMIIKVDDDVFVNIFILLDYYLPLFRQKTKFIQCHVRPKGTSFIQRSFGKWKIKQDEFKNMTYYPVDYCNGYIVLMSPDIIRGLYKASYLTPFFWVDDVYLYGLLPFKFGGVQFQHLDKNITLFEDYGLKCFTGISTCTLVGSYAMVEGHMEQMWYGSLTMFRSVAKRYISNEMYNILYL